MAGGDHPRAASLEQAGHQVLIVTWLEPPPDHGQWCLLLGWALS
jgi:hypothetical protein